MPNMSKKRNIKRNPYSIEDGIKDNFGVNKSVSGKLENKTDHGHHAQETMIYKTTTTVPASPIFTELIAVEEHKNELEMRECEFPTGEEGDEE